MLNQHTDSWRRTRAEVLVDNITDLDCGGSVDEAGAVDTTQALVGALRTLPPQQRAAVVLRHYCDLSERQVAQELGISVGTVKSNTSRGLETLRLHLIEQENAHGH